MAYSVFGFRSGTLDTVRLHIESLKRKGLLMPYRWQERMMRGYTVEAEGFDLLERRFNVVGAFQNFVLLDDVCIEACKELNVPLGTLLGVIELTEMSGLANKMFAWAYYSPAEVGWTMIEVGDTVAVNGEAGNWEVDMAGNGTDMVRVIKNGDASTWRMINRSDLTLVSKPTTDDGPRFVPERSILG
jgi:hypothetical protein